MSLIQRLYYMTGLLFILLSFPHFLEKIQKLQVQRSCIQIMPFVLFWRLLCIAVVYIQRYNWFVERSLSKVPLYTFWFVYLYNHLTTSRVNLPLMHATPASPDVHPSFIISWEQSISLSSVPVHPKSKILRFKLLIPKQFSPQYSAPSQYII